MGAGLLRLPLPNLHKGGQDISLGDDPYQAVSLDHWKAADPAFEEKAGSIGNGGFRIHCDHLFRHDFPHQELLERVMGIPLARARRKCRWKNESDIPVRDDSDELFLLYHREVPDLMFAQ